MNYVNLTPDVVNIYASGVDGTGADTNENTMSLSVLPSGQIAHVSVNLTQWNKLPDAYYERNMKLYGKSPSLEEIRNYAASLVLEEDDGHVILSASWKHLMEEMSDPGNTWAADGKWVRCTIRQWWEALEALPPAAWNGAAFAMGEPATHNDVGAVYHVFYKDSKTDECFTRRDNLRFFNPIRYKAEIAATFNGGEPPVQPPGQAESYSDGIYWSVAA